ncbi:MAG TPA: J domain-containing protein [Thermoanaerobaculia bacterium]|nr:J domain-containing protein [Thermoanaerobaculia bacterium]
MDYKDYYKTLGVERSASQQEIQRAYRKLARKYHPDISKEPEAENRFKEITEAYEVLKDADKRQKYDQFGQAWKQADRGGGVGPPPGWEQVVFGGPGGGRVEYDFGGFGPGGGFGAPGGGSGFSDFFEMLFGQAAGAAGGAGARPGGYRADWVRRGGDQEAHIQLTLEEAANGGERSITLTDPQNGTQQTVRVKIPRGIKPGQKIRLAAKGGAGAGGGPPGDLYLTVDVLPHARFRLDGSDLHTAVPITPWEAALGGTAQLETLDGPVTVRIPAGSPAGRKIRLRGYGYPQAKGGKGDLYAELDVVVPTQLTPRERELFEELAKVSTFNPRRG